MKVHAVDECPVHIKHDGADHKVSLLAIRNPNLWSQLRQYLGCEGIDKGTLITSDLM